MPLSEKLRRYASTAEWTVAKMLERQAELTRGYDELQGDPDAGLVGFSRMGENLFKARTEHIANYYPDIGMFRWAWALRSPTARASRVDAAIKEGESHGLEELTASHVSGIEDEDAALLSNLAAQIAKAHGVLRVPQGEHFAFYALYPAEAGATLQPGAYSIAPPEVTPSYAPGASRSRAPSGMIGQGAAPLAREVPMVSDVTLAPPPLRPRDKPTGESPVRIATPAARPVREPGRLVLTPFAQQASSDLARLMPGYQQALVIVTVNRQEAKGRFFVTLAALDAKGLLQALEPSPETVTAGAQLIKADNADGNGPWRRLVIRFAPKPSGGASLALLVE